MERYKAEKGFTMVELLIFASIFAVASTALLTILVSVTRLQVRQSAAAEVNQQSQFLLQTIQRYIEQSSLVELDADLATSTLKLRMASTTYDPTTVYLSGGIVYVRETDAGSPQPLTSSKVNVPSLVFKKRSNPAGHDAVSVAFTVEFNTQSIQQRFLQALNISVARVSAANFDSNIVPSTGNVYKLGVAAADWQSINNTVFFSGSNVGIGVSTPNQTLEILGGVRLNTTGGRPACGSSQRGTFWVTQSGAGVKDSVEVCAKDSGDLYNWRTIY